MARNIASSFPFASSYFPSRTACNYKILTRIIFPAQRNINLTNASAVNTITIYVCSITKWREIIFIYSVWGGPKGNNKVDKEFGSLSAERRSKTANWETLVGADAAAGLSLLRRRWMWLSFTGASGDGVGSGCLTL